MSEQVMQLLSEVEVGEADGSAGFQVFGLHREGGPGLNYATLDESLAADLVEVAEVSEAGRVPQLKVIHKGDTMLFLMAGEQLIGAKQNRVLNASIMVQARSEQLIPVSCTEAGRWAYRRRGFWSSGTSSHGKLRALLSRQVYDSYRRQGVPRSDQAGVWAAVAAKLRAMSSHSDSIALEQAYEDYEARLKEVLDRHPIPKGCTGVVFAVHGRIAGGDLFDQPATLAKLWPKLVRAYALDALEPREDAQPVTRNAVREWLCGATQGKMERFKSVGLGDDVRIQARELVGAGLVVDDQLVHVEIFAEVPAGPSS